MRYILKYIVQLYDIKNDHTYDIVIIKFNEIMEIIRRTIGWHDPGHKLPAMYDFCLHICRTDIVGLSIVVIRLAWTYFKLFFHIMFTFGSLFFCTCTLIYLLSTRIWLSPVTFYQNER